MLLLILSTLLWVLGGLLAFLLLVLVVLLFSPFVYSAEFGYTDNVFLKARASWIFSALGFTYDNEREEKSVLRILWIKPKKRTKKKKFKEEAEEDKEEEDKEEEDKEEDKEENKENKTEKKEKRKEKIQSKAKRFLESAKRTYGKIKEVLEYPDKDIILKETSKLTVRLIKALGLRKYDIWVKFGLSNPADTGMAMGAACAAAGLTGIWLKLEPDFENQVFLAKCGIKGRTNLFKILFPICLYVFKEPVYKIVKERFFKS